MKRLKYLSTGLFIIFLLGCSDKAPSAIEAQGVIHEPPDGMEQLILYYPSSIFWGDKTAHIDLGERVGACDLKTGSFFIRDMVATPKTTITASLCGVPGATRLILNTVAGKKYYIRVSPLDDTLVGRIGSSGLVKAKEKLKYAGPFRLDIMDEKAALGELQKLEFCSKCLENVTAQ